LAEFQMGLIEATTGKSSSAQNTHTQALVQRHRQQVGYNGKTRTVLADFRISGVVHAAQIQQLSNWQSGALRRICITSRYLSADTSTVTRHSARVTA
jgi:hypothetical protein